ncbi:MAG TPA: glycosyltransferase family 39 protein [Terriglobales bacterium]
MRGQRALTWRDQNTVYSSLREILHKHARFFVLATLAGLALRIFFLRWFPSITADSFVYGDIAKNWLQHGVYGQTEFGQIVATDIRLPGYPAFLAAIFAIFGMEHYRAALVVQILIDLGTCFVVADLVLRLFSARAAKVAFLLAALCPFLANYAAAALTETLEILFTALALDFAVAALQALDRSAGGRRINLLWLGCGLAVGACTLIRPDGILLLAAFLIWIVYTIVRKHGEASALRLLNAGTILILACAATLLPWTVRNLISLHRFQPLAPRYANEPDTYVPAGFNRWVKTWIADYVSNEEIYWMVPGIAIDPDNLPNRAFDSDDQMDETQQLVDQYNHALQVDPTLDAQFAALARQRIHDAPLRYYVWLPALRMASMWLRPRTELLPCNQRWWEFDDYRKWLWTTIVFGVLNLLYIASACAGWVRARMTPHLGLLVLFVFLRTLFLGTLENPEPRYTLEVYPVVIVLASALFERRKVFLSSASPTLGQR